MRLLKNDDILSKRLIIVLDPLVIHLEIEFLSYTATSRVSILIIQMDMAYYYFFEVLI